MEFHVISSSSQQQLQSLEDAATSLEPERLTPLKFTSTHSSASFQDGLLVCVKQKYMPGNEIQNNVHIMKFGKFYQTFVCNFMIKSCEINIIFSLFF